MFDLSGGYHFIGIGGVGMSALAFMLHDMGYYVSGSDAGDSPFLDKLIQRGIKVFRSHSPSNIGNAKNVVYSSAISRDNPELSFAIKQGLRVMHRAELLEIVMDSYKRVGVTGTHGKTTTSAMIMKMFIDLGFDPSGVIGGDYPYIGGNYRSGKGQFFVAEVDESDGSFLFLSGLDYLIITNLEEEHLEHYVDFEDLKNKILQLAEISRLVIYNADDPVLRNMNLKGVSYGFIHGSFKGKIIDIRTLDAENFGLLKLSVAGKHNLYNALGVLALSKEIGLERSRVIESLQSFKGVKRRMEVLGEYNGILFMDDYAHHPTEIEVVLQTLRSVWRDRRIVVVFQPHRYSRTAKMYKDIASSLDLADWVGVMEIYSASEPPIEGVSGKLIYEVLRFRERQNVYFFSGMEDAQKVLLEELKSGDLFITIGAGDVYKLGKTLLAKFKEGC